MNWLRKKNRQTEHDYTEDRLSAYLDGQLTSQERAIVDRHLATCEDCCSNLRTLGQTIEWTRGMTSVCIPCAFTIPATAESYRTVRAPRATLGLPLLRGATALVALLLVFVVAGDFLLGGLALRPASQPIALMTQAPAMKAVEEAAPTAVAEEAMLMVAETEASAAAMALPPSAISSAEVSTSQPDGTNADMLAPTLMAADAETAQARELAGEGPLLTATAPIESAVGGGPAGTPEVEKAAAAPATQEVAQSSFSVTAPITMTLAITAVQTATSTPAPEATPLAEPPAPMPAPMESPAIAVALAPTAIAAAPEADVVEQDNAAGEEGQEVGAVRRAVVPWLSLAEIVLGIAFVLLASATLVITLRRRAR
jgi:anti-sigma factor RsiW